VLKAQQHLFKAFLRAVW